MYVSAGEGTTSQGDFHEALNVASVWNLPVLFCVENNGYGGYGYGMDNEDIIKKKNDRFPVYGYWSSDSKKFVFQKTDRTKIKDLWVINSVGKKRPTLETYKYHMAGEEAEYKHCLLYTSPSPRDRG